MDHRIHVLNESRRHHGMLRIPAFEAGRKGKPRPRLFGIPRNDSQLMTTHEELTCDRMAQETGAARDENPHSLVKAWFNGSIKALRWNNDSTHLGAWTAVAMYRARKGG